MWCAPANRKSRCSAEDTVRRYKSLAQVERAFRSLKGMDLRIRPIHHRTEDHVRAHILLCMLAYYVEWHMRRALAPLLFDDEELRQDRPRRDPVAPAESSASAQAKKICPAYRRRLAGAKLPHSLAQPGHALPQHLPDPCRPERRHLPAVDRAHAAASPRASASRPVARNRNLAPCCSQIKSAG